MARFSAYGWVITPTVGDMPFRAKLPFLICLLGSSWWSMSLTTIGLLVVLLMAPLAHIAAQAPAIVVEAPKTDDVEMLQSQIALLESR